MSTFLFLTILFLTSFGGKAFSKLCSDAVVGHSKVRYAVFMVVNGSVACLFFFISGGFSVDVNFPTLLYSAVYALIVVVSLVSNMIALKYVNIVTMTVVTGALGLISTSAVGIWLFNESIDAEKIIRIVIMTAAVVLFALDGKTAKKERSDALGFSVTAVAVVAVMLIVNCANTLITKYYAIDSRVCDANSFFFFTNVILVAVSLLLVTADLIKNPSGFEDITPLFKPLNLLSLSGNTVCSNIGSLVGILIISKMDVSVYAPVSSAIGILAGFLGSLVFRQKMGLLSCLGVIGALVAVII